MSGEQLRIISELLCEILMKRIKLASRRLLGRALCSRGTLWLCGFWCMLGVLQGGGGSSSSTVSLVSIFLANTNTHGLWPCLSPEMPKLWLKLSRGKKAWKEPVVQNKENDNGLNYAGFSFKRLLFSQKYYFLRVHKAACLKEHLLHTWGVRKRDRLVLKAHQNDV